MIYTHSSFKRSHPMCLKKWGGIYKSYNREVSDSPVRSSSSSIRPSPRLALTTCHPSAFWAFVGGGYGCCYFFGFLVGLQGYFVLMESLLWYYWKVLFSCQRMSVILPHWSGLQNFPPFSFTLPSHCAILKWFSLLEFPFQWVSYQKGWNLERLIFTFCLQILFISDFFVFFSYQVEGEGASILYSNHRVFFGFSKPHRSAFQRE